MLSQALHRKSSGPCINSIFTIGPARFLKPGGDKDPTMRPAIAFWLLPILSFAGCSDGARRVAPEAPVARPVVAAPMPRPPFGAAPNLSLPMRLADGGYATPNRDLSEAATLWHVRAALNVAVLTCPQSPALVTHYNRLLSTHRGPLAKAHAGVTAEYRGGDLDAAMTRVYNYFAQPPAQHAFCPVAADLLSQAFAVPPADLAGFARRALARLDAPFVDFYRAYDAYRSDLALWRAGTTPDIAPQLAYDAEGFLRDDALTGRGPVRIAATR